MSGELRSAALGRGTWQERLALVIETMREMSLQTDPQAMVRAYGERMKSLIPLDRRISLSRRGLEYPRLRVTRFSEWREEINPWKEPHRLPVIDGGLFAELIYGDEPVVIDDLDVPEDDPAAPYLAGQRSLLAIPMLDQGVATNMVIGTREEPAAFDREELPEVVWMSNLFGRAAHNLVMREQVEQAYQLVDRELQVVADIQRSLLPRRMPEIPGVRLAAHYQTSRRAGGDYYDFFPLADGRWGILIADVSGHGTPAAVMMAVTHAIAHAYPGSSENPSALLEFVNRRLAERYTVDSGTFVTAFYGIYDPSTRTLTYSSAGHNPPRIKSCRGGTIESLDGARRLPLGVSADEDYIDATRALQTGDQIVFYTDGVTESEGARGVMFGVERLDSVLHACRSDAGEIIEGVLTALAEFTDARPAADDRTLLVAKIG
ncbi:MAG: PP2C family protein-serine/threonine phosphatase [Planctomycetales bacterium]